jgi:hypothetical protein
VAGSSGAKQLAELWNSGDLESWLDELGPDFEVHPGPQLSGRRHVQGGGDVPLQDFTLVLFYVDDSARARRMAAYFDPEQARQAADPGTG